VLIATATAINLTTKLAAVVIDIVAAAIKVARNDLWKYYY